MANGEYAADLALLDLDMSSDAECRIAGTERHQLWCKGFALDNGTAFGKAAGYYNFTYCPTTSESFDSYSVCAQKAALNVHGNYTSRERSCSSLDRLNGLQSLFCPSQS